MSDKRGLDEHDWMAECFESERPHLRAVAYRLLGEPKPTRCAIRSIGWSVVSSKACA